MSPTPATTIPADSVAAVRGFNRFYTRYIGVLHPSLLRSEFSLTEVRILYEIANRADPTAAELAADLGLDPGYVSRILAGFVRRGLIERRRASLDSRRHHLRLSRAGRATFGNLDRAASAEVAAELARLGDGARRELLEGMRRVQQALGATAAPAAIVLRNHQPGDLGWIVSRHGAIYAAEYQFGAPFEALVARIAARFLERYDPDRERCWIAERDGERVGSVMLVSRSQRVGQLRLLLVEPAARGTGLGVRLVDECTRFARAAGYAKIVLTTNGMLHAAVGIYRKAGYRKIAEDPSESYGNQTWELVL
jgi:DNA-binding MarR family transcriptional regulator/GNAT superfamily N-acetyltransferase